MQAARTERLQGTDLVVADSSSSPRPSIQKPSETFTDSEEPVAPNNFVKYARKIYHPIGFRKGYNFVLFFILAGAMFGFVLARLPYLNISGSHSTSFMNSTLPTEWYWYRQGRYRFGITLHLSTCLPGALFMLLQFVPVIRYKALIVHRINGYLVLTLLTLSNIGALMIADKAFGGTIETQSIVGSLVIMTTVSMGLAVYNIKMLQIEQHRKWMLRCMTYMGVIITIRIIMIISTLIISSQGTYYEAFDCDILRYSIQQTSPNDAVATARFSSSYPMCVSNNPNATTNGHVAVQVSFGTSAEGVAAGFKHTFGNAGWLALLIHAVGVEIYLALTPRESERLRRVSYERQLERGMKNAGRAGLTADRIGDAELWHAPQKTSQK